MGGRGPTHPGAARPSGPWPDRLGDAFAALDRAGVAWCLLRPVTSLGSTEGDVDLLVAPAELERARAALMGDGFVPLPVARPHLHVGDYDPGSDRLLWLDLQPTIELAGATIPASVALAHVSPDPIPHLDDSWMLWSLLLRSALTSRALPERHRDEIRRLALDPSTADAIPAELQVVAGTGPIDATVLRSMAESGDWDGIARSGPGAAPPPRPLSTRIRARLDWARGIWRWRGVCVAVIGPDGAGKTTLVTGLPASLPFPTRTVYMGLTGGRLPAADRLRIPGLVFLARVGLLWARWGLAMAHMARGRIVLLDRHPIDAAVPSGHPLRPVAELSRRVQGRMVPVPALVLLLDASGATMVGRKGEYEAARLDEWRAGYRALASRVRGLRVIDAEQPADAVRREAAALIWAQYRRRWSR